MSRVINEKKMKKPPIQTSIMTSLGLIKGEILEHLEERGLTTQNEMLSSLQWPSVLISISIGDLINDGMIRAKKFNGELVLFESTSKNKLDVNNQRKSFSPDLRLVADA